jgi:hypothetical protein
MPGDVIIVIATLIIVIITLLVSWLVFILLIRVVKASIITALGIAAIVLSLQLVFGLSPFVIWQYINQSFQTILQSFQTILRVVTGG